MFWSVFAWLPVKVLSGTEVGGSPCQRCVKARHITLLQVLHQGCLQCHEGACAGAVLSDRVCGVQVARAGDLADWLVRKSMLHPAMRDVPVRYDMVMGGWPDPTTRQAAGAFEPLTLQLQRAAYRKALTLIQCAPLLAPSVCTVHSSLHCPANSMVLALPN